MKQAKHFHLVLRLKMREYLSPARHMHVLYDPNVMGIARTQTSQMAYCRYRTFIQNALLKI